MTMRPSLPDRKEKPYPPGSLREKIRSRRIFGTLAAYLASGWLAYEIVHFILVDHYGLPQFLKDITIVSVLCALLCTLAWQWFRGEGSKRTIKWERILVPAFILVAGGVNAAFVLRSGRHGPDRAPATGPKNSWRYAVAVLPFLNISADKEQEYFCDGLTEELITKLSHLRELKVTARTSAFVFKGEDRDIRDIGRKLGVDKVLEGSVRKNGSKLRISAQLINASDGFHLWSETYDRDLVEVFAIQDDIALSVAGALKVALLAGPDGSAGSPDIEAYNEYLLGRHDFSNPTKEHTEAAIRHFLKAINLDPSFAKAWASLGAAQAAQAGFGYVPSEEGFAKAKASIEKALALDSRLAHAYSIRGWILMTYDWDWDGAQASLDKAQSLEADSGLVDSSQLALALGHAERALVLARRAAELDSLNATAVMARGLAAFYAGRLPEAAAALRKVLEINPDRANNHSLLGQVLLAQSRPAEALEVIAGEKDRFWRLPPLAMAYHALGRKGDSDDALAEFARDFDKFGGFQVAQVLAFRGEDDAAFKWLEKAYAERDGGLAFLKSDPYLKRLSGDPRFSSLLKRMGFSSTSSDP